jgi:hypothetical protein
MRAFLVLLSLASLALGPGCAGTDTLVVGTGRYQVISKTPFYKHGPAQAVGPDFSMKPGTKVTVIKREFGYSRIMLDNGQSGYVATEALGPVAKEEETKKKKKQTDYVRRRTYNYEPLELPTEPPLPLPEPELPAPKPPFRY